MRLKSIEIGIEEVILGIIILLNFLDAFEILPSDLDYVKKIISWSALGYLFYTSSPTNIFTGTTNKRLDGLIVTGYFLLIIKNLISYVHVAKITAFLGPFYTWLIANGTLIEIYGLYAGLALLVVSSVYTTLRCPIKAPSILHIIHAEGKPEHIKEFFLRVMTIFLLKIVFFVIVFNLMMEWLAIAIDAPLLMIGLSTYVLFVARHHTKFKAGSFLSRFGDFGSTMYKDVIAHFKYKTTILRAVSAVLILHVVTDTLIYIWPLLFGIADPLYFGILQHHPSLFELIRLFPTEPYAWSLSLFALLTNIVGLVFLLVFPAIMWYAVYKKKKLHTPKPLFILIFMSVCMMFVTPVFSIEPLSSPLYGVDFLAHNPIIPSQVELFIMIFLVVAIMLSITRHHNKVLTMISQSFMIFYIITYIRSLTGYFVKTIPAVYSASMYIILLFLVITALTLLGLYLGGVIAFIRDTHNHFKNT